MGKTIKDSGEKTSETEIKKKFKCYMKILLRYAPIILILVTIIYYNSDIEIRKQNISREIKIKSEERIYDEKIRDLENIQRDIPQALITDFIKMKRGKKISIDEQIDHLLWLNYMDLGDKEKIAKHFLRAIKYYNKASESLSDQPMSHHKSGITAFEYALNQKDETKLHAVLDESKCKFDSVLAILKRIENKVIKIYDTEEELTPKKLKARTFFYLGKIYLFKVVLDKNKSEEYLIRSYRFFNASWEMGYCKAKIGLDYISNNFTILGYYLIPVTLFYYANN